MKTAIVTGASRGIGEAVARALVSEGCSVVLLCRDAARGEAVRASLARLGPGQARLVTGHLDTLSGIRAAAAALEAACPRSDVLVHNAGVWPARRVLGPDGLEQAFVVNHLAPFLLNHLLADALSRARGRVVQVSAGLYVKGRPSLARTPRGEDFGSIHTYATTKLCNLALLPRYAALLAPRGVTIHALHPGVIRTDLGDRPGPLGALLRIVKRTWKAPEEGARPVVRLALEPSFASTTGRYFEVDDERPLAQVAADPALAEALWLQASTLCGLEPLHSAASHGEAATQ